VQVRLADGTVESIAAVALPERFDEKAATAKARKIIFVAPWC
jgi:hypothetical protein